MKRLALIALGTIPGVAVAGMTTFIHAERVKIFGITIVFGVFLAVAIILVAQLWLTRYFQTRTIAIGYALGWLVTTIGLALWPTSQDLALPDESRTWAYLALGAVAVSLGASLPVLRLPQVAHQTEQSVLS